MYVYIYNGIKLITNNYRTEVWLKMRVLPKLHLFNREHTIKQQIYGYHIFRQPNRIFTFTELGNVWGGKRCTFSKIHVCETWEM